MNVFTGDHHEESLFINLAIMSPVAIDPNVYSSKNSDRFWPDVKSALEAIVTKGIPTLLCRPSHWLTHHLSPPTHTRSTAIIIIVIVLITEKSSQPTQSTVKIIEIITIIDWNFISAHQLVIPNPTQPPQNWNYSSLVLLLWKSHPRSSLLPHVDKTPRLTVSE